MYLKTMYDQDMLSEEDILSWYRSDPVQLLQHIPHSTSIPTAATHIHQHPMGGDRVVSFEKTAVTEAEVVALKKKAEIIIKFLETEDDDDEEEEEGDEEEEEEEDD